MSSARRLHYEGVIYRFKFLMMATLLCATLTVIGFILGQVNEFSPYRYDKRRILKLCPCIKKKMFILLHIIRQTRWQKVNGNGTKIWN